MTDTQRTTLQKTRQDFIDHLTLALHNASDAGLARLLALTEEFVTTAQAHERQLAFLEFHKLRLAWVQAAAHWHQSLIRNETPAGVPPSEQGLAIEATEVMEQKIMAARLAMFFQHLTSSAFNDLRIRVLHVEQRPDLSLTDIFQPTVVATSWIEAWDKVGLSPRTWELCTQAIQQAFRPFLLTAYEQANATLVDAGILPHIDFRAMLKRNKEATPTPGMTLAQEAAHIRDAASMHPSRSTQPAPASSTPMPVALAISSQGRAQHMVGQLVGMLRDKVGWHPPSGTDRPADRGLDSDAADSNARRTVLNTTLGTVVADAGVHIPQEASPAQAVALLKEQSATLKRKAATHMEKATIEIVALMFQSILSENGIAERIRLLIARLQMPVIRVALTEPAFFDSLDHPARKLIDRLGSCALGLDTTSTARAALEKEILRMVQVIEQYPETGHKVFRIVLNEFELFLRRHLNESESSRKVVGIAQQIEQKETLAIQYTIEIRNLIKDFVISETVREFLLKTWTEVLAMTAVRHGTGSDNTMRCKEVASQLVWASGAKPNRADRMRMIAEMPGLLQQLRQGMQALALPANAIETRITSLSEALTNAFNTKSDAIPAQKISEMNQRLQHLEELFTDDNLGDLPIDSETIELMLDMDAQALTVITDMPVQPGEAARHWAREIEIGRWFNLHHAGSHLQLQYAWHSDLRQLHLFASANGKSVLIQAHALAAYLQAGHLKPMEEESLSVRATRQALDKINANPSQLLG